MRKVKFGKKGIKKAKGIKGIPFVLTYHPQLNNLGRIINQNIYFLNVNEETKKVFSEVCMNVSERTYLLAMLLARQIK